MIQRHLFEPTLIKSASLVAPDSPGQAFYNLWLFAYKNIYTVRKEVGQKERPGTCDYGNLIHLKRLRKILSAGSNKKQTPTGNQKEYIKSEQ